MEKTTLFEYNITLGDYMAQEDDYVKRHERVLKKERKESLMLKLSLGIMTATALLGAFVLAAKI